MNDFIDKADEEHAEKTGESLTLEEYIEKCVSGEITPRNSTKYLLEAIEHYGTRTVYENNKELERYRFFDDPFGDNEYAVLGNTQTLNEFVDSLRRMASDDGNSDRIVWFLGPTATGKSELKRCIINGIKGFSQTQEGRRYTIEWTLDSLQESSMTYGTHDGGNKNWYKSPVNINPLAVIPEDTREEIVQQINQDEEYPTQIEYDIDPFSREAYKKLEEYEDSFKDIVDSGHVRVNDYDVQEGDGVGILHVEDIGDPKSKLVGTWMRGKSNSRGRSDPQNFSYDGLVCQGNTSVSIIEDANHHSDLLSKLLNVTEEEMVKIDNKHSMDIDTLLLCISNPDLESNLEEYKVAEQEDPFRALRRRMDKYHLGYLVDLSLETQLVRRHITGNNELWTDESEDGELERIAEPIQIYDTEISPHAIETASMYNVISRLYEEEVQWPISIAMGFEQGYYKTSTGRTDFNEDSWDLDYVEKGIPVTYTVDVLNTLIEENDLIMPSDITEKVDMKLSEGSLFSESEVQNFMNCREITEEYIYERMEEDVLEAMLRDVEPSEEEISEYVDQVFAWFDQDDEDFDKWEMMEFEKKYLGTESAEYFGEAEPYPEIEDFRKDRIFSPLKNYVWEKRNEDFEVDILYSECPELANLIQDRHWSLVEKIYPDIDLKEWDNPPEDTVTDEVKEETIENMKELFGYSEESAEKASQRVINMQNKGEL